MSSLSKAGRATKATFGDLSDLVLPVCDAVSALRRRVDALDGGVGHELGAKAVKPRVRVPVGYTFQTKQFGQTYETTDGINFRIVR